MVEKVIVDGKEIGGVTRYTLPTANTPVKAVIPAVGTTLKDSRSQAVYKVIKSGIK